MNGIAAGLCGLALLLAFPAGERVQVDFVGARSEARAAFLKELEGYVEWCQEKQLFQEKQKALELVLEIDPDHAEARKVLGFTRAKDGTWKEPAKPKAFRNFDKKALEEAPQRFRVVCGGYVEAMIGLLERPELDADQRALAAQEGLRFDPDNERLHEFVGDVRGEKGWVLPETLRAKTRREELRGFVREALESPPVAAPVELLEREKKIPLSLRAVATPRLRVVGTVPVDELVLCAQAVHGMERLLQLACSTKYELPAASTVFLLGDPRQKSTFLDNHPDLDADQRRSYAALEGAGLQGTDDFAFWTGDAQRRIDGIVRLVLGYLMSGTFHITIANGWAYEGFGLVLTRSLVRTRMTWLAQPSQVLDAKADFALRQKLLDPESNWMDEAHQMMLGPHRPPLIDLMKRTAGQLTTEDVLYAYALATYLLEAQPDKVAPLLSKIGVGLAPGSALQEILGMDAATFERHLSRWMAERS